MECRAFCFVLHGITVVAEWSGSPVECFAYDGLGSVRQILDSAGSPLLAQTFDPYGNSFSRTGTGQSAYGYAGEQTDSNGLVFLRARYYAPSMGRFMQLDPSRQETNPYRYSVGNPVNRIDPSGLCSQYIAEGYELSKYLTCLGLLSRIYQTYGIWVYSPNDDGTMDIMPGECPILYEDSEGRTSSMLYWDIDELRQVELGLDTMRKILQTRSIDVTQIQ